MYLILYIYFHLIHDSRTDNLILNFYIYFPCVPFSIATITDRLVFECLSSMNFHQENFPFFLIFKSRCTNGGRVG